jgi:hypothetical protein
MEDESSTGHIWATGFHRVMARSHLAHSLKIMNRFSNFSKNFFSGRGKLWITETADMGVRLYVHSFIHSFIQSLNHPLKCSQNVYSLPNWLLTVLSEEKKKKILPCASPL